MFVMSSRSWIADSRHSKCWYKLLKLHQPLSEVDSAHCPKHTTEILQRQTLLPAALASTPKACILNVIALDFPLHFRGVHLAASFEEALSTSP